MRSLAFCLLLLGTSAWAQREKGIEANSVEFAVGGSLRGCFLGTDVLTAHLTPSSFNGSAGLGLHLRMNKLLGSQIKIGVAFGGLGVIGDLRPGVSMIEWRPLTTFFRVNMGAEEGQGFFLEVIPLGVSLFSATVAYPDAAVEYVATTAYSSYRWGMQAGYRWRAFEFGGGFQLALGGRVTVMEVGTSISFYFFPW